MGDPAAARRKGQRPTIAVSARTIARLMTIARDHLSKADTVTIAAIEAGVPTLVDARKLIDRFHAMVRKRIEASLDPWIKVANQNLVASFASGISNDRASVHAALVQPWSNGQTEGQINKPKLVKRQMYGREDRSSSGQTNWRIVNMAEHHRDCVRPPIERRSRVPFRAD